MLQVQIATADAKVLSQLLTLISGGALIQHPLGVWLSKKLEDFAFEFEGFG